LLENRFDVTQKHDADGAILGSALAGQRQSRLASTVRPLAADAVGDRQQGLPIIRGAIVETFRYGNLQRGIT
jgi:hypothetical protein